MYLKEKRCGLDSCGWEEKLVAQSCECRNELAVFTKGGDHLDCTLYALWRQLFIKNIWWGTCKGKAHGTCTPTYNEIPLLLIYFFSITYEYILCRNCILLLNPAKIRLFLKQIQIKIKANSTKLTVCTPNWSSPSTTIYVHNHSFRIMLMWPYKAQL
jgi:hypothetical protein